MCKYLFVIKSPFSKLQINRFFENVMLTSQIYCETFPLKPRWKKCNYIGWEPDGADFMGFPAGFSKVRDEIDYTFTHIIVLDGLVRICGHHFVFECEFESKNRRCGCYTPGGVVDLSFDCSKILIKSVNIVATSFTVVLCYRSCRLV